MSDETVRIDDEMNRVLRDLEDVIDSYYEAKREHDEAYKDYDGHSWDWHGRGVIERLDEARLAYRKAFIEAVRMVAASNPSIGGGK